MNEEVREWGMTIREKKVSKYVNLYPLQKMK
jgi:hypothetical protein